MEPNDTMVLLQVCNKLLKPDHWRSLLGGVLAAMSPGASEMNILGYLSVVIEDDQ